MVPAAAAGIEPPAHLAALLALVAGHPHQIKARQRRLQLGNQRLRPKVHVVAAEHQHGAGRGGVDGGVVSNRQGLEVGEVDPRHQLAVLRLLQRAAQQRVTPEDCLLQSGGRNQLEHLQAHGRSDPSGPWGRSSSGLSAAARSA